MLDSADVPGTAKVVIDLPRACSIRQSLLPQLARISDLRIGHPRKARFFLAGPDYGRKFVQRVLSRSRKPEKPDLVSFDDRVTLFDEGFLWSDDEFSTNGFEYLLVEALIANR